MVGAFAIATVKNPEMVIMLIIKDLEYHRSSIYSLCQLFFIHFFALWDALSIFIFLEYFYCTLKKAETSPDWTLSLYIEHLL